MDRLPAAVAEYGEPTGWMLVGLMVLSFVLKVALAIIRKRLGK